MNDYEALTDLREILSAILAELPERELYLVFLFARGLRAGGVK